MNKNNWGIRQQIITLALLPVLLASVTLTIYFTSSQLDLISESQIRHGNVIAKQLAPVSEYAVFSGNIDSLIPILQKTLNEKDVISIRVIDKNNNILASINDYSPNKQQETIKQKINNEESSVFKEAIINQTLDVDFLNDDGDDASNTDDEVIGYIEVTLTSEITNIKKLEAIAKGSSITLLILISSIVLALRLSKKITTPVRALTHAVKKISSGDYQTRINQDATAELGILESCVNIMAEELQSSRDNLEAKIDESTRELHGTMEELEIRNIELDIARSNAIQSNKAKTEFLANMSHELRTPLGGILGFSKLLGTSNLEAEQQDYAEIIKKSADNLLHILDDVLDLSKIESGKLEIQYSEFNIIDIVEEVIDLLIITAYEKNIELFYCLDIKTPNIITSDPIRVRQILFNLIGNAIKFTEKGSVSVRISSHQEEKLTTIKFSVVDTGIGMNPSQQNRLFNAFTQADKSIEKKFGGTGLGLVISKKLANLIGGDINFKSHYEKGSSFTLSLSVKHAVHNETNNKSLSGKKVCLIDYQCSCEEGVTNMLLAMDCAVEKYDTIPNDALIFDLILVCIGRTSMDKEKTISMLPKNNTDTPVLAIVSTRSHKELINIKKYGFNDAIFRSSKQALIHQTISKLINKHDLIKEVDQTDNTKLYTWSELNILVVDDNDINLKLAKILLSTNGAQVMTASTGKDAIAKSNKHEFDLIFMDLQMPDMDGYESARAIRDSDDNEKTIIIALTANAMATKESEKIKQHGMNGILIKPINEISIQKTIDRWLFKSQTINTIPLFSKSEALALTAGNTKLANELTSMLIRGLPEYSKKINDALSNDDIEHLTQQIHKLHGAVNCCGTLALRNAIEKFDSDLTDNILENIEINIEQLNLEIKKLINADDAVTML